MWVRSLFDLNVFTYTALVILRTGETITRS